MRGIQRLAATLGITLGVSLIASTGWADTVLRAVSFQPLDSTNGQYFREFMDRIDAEVPGVTVQVIGGPEAMPPDEQGNAVSSGIVDIAQLTPSRFLGQFPIASYYSITDKSPEERRANGTFDFLNELYGQRMNTRAIASTFYPMSYHIYLGDVGEQALAGDFSGLMIRGNPTYRPLFDRLGIVTIDIAPPEIYTAMERGTVGGYGWPPFDVVKLGFGPVTRHRVEPSFFHAETVYLLNEDTWQSLTDEQREALTRVAADFEIYAGEAVAAIIEDEYAIQAEAGIEPLTLEGEARDRFLAAATEAGWADVQDKLPDLYETLREMDGL